MNGVMWSDVDVVFWEVGGGYGGFAVENWRRRLAVVMV